MLRFYVIERSNPTSIFSAVHAARENARALRPLISTEMWTQLNMLYNRLLALKPTDVAEEKLSGLCDWIKRGCDAHTGITAGTFYRDEGWCFYQLGAAIECADQTTRLLDAKFLNFMAQDGPRPRLGSRQLLLDGAAALGRRLPGVPPPPPARHGAGAGGGVPAVRPVLPALGRLLPGHHRRAAHRPAPLLQPARPPVRRSSSWTSIRDNLEVRKVKAAIANGELHRFNDFLQRSFSELTGLIADASSGHAAGGRRRAAALIRPSPA